MTSKGSHFNRAARRSGGDRPFILMANWRAMSRRDRIKLAIGMISDAHPDWDLPAVAAAVMKTTACTADQLIDAMRDFVSD